FYDAGWDLDTIWGRDTNNVENDGYLGLRALSNFDFNTVVTATLVDQTKIYDGTSDVLATLNKANVIDSVAFTGNKDVGTYAFTSTLGDYGLTYATGFNSSNTEALIYGSGNSVITQKALTLSGITASNKVYDGTTTASTAATLSGLIAGDTVSNSIASTFNDKNVGTAKTVTVDTVTLAGTDSANYAIATGQTTTANVTQKALIPSGITANNKVYDGTTTATVNATLAGLIGGDSVSIASTFDDESIGVAKTVTLNSLAGTDGANYSAVLGQTTTADITAIPVVASTVADNTVSNIISTIFNDAAVTSNPLIQPVIPDVNTSPYGSTAVEPVDQPSKLITMSELKEANNDNSDELRTPVYEDSPLTLVNKGLHMPTGVDQQFFIPEDDDDKDER
ncbi:MAG: hypothetical protein KAT04_00370, partial [Methylococcales bacterium]|nr:hypothetical protein [Methylococcales bacterium]